MTGLSEWFDSSDNYNKFVFALSELPPVIPQYTEAEIQRMQELEQAEIQKAYELRKAEMQPCEDVISRQAVEDAIADMVVNGESLGYAVASDILSDLPPVTPQPKMGRWIEVTNGRGGHECDLCYEYAPSYQSGDEYLSQYCPKCGAKMQEVEE
jgi:hypothetical protein